MKLHLRKRNPGSFLPGAIIRFHMRHAFNVRTCKSPYTRFMSED